MKASPALAVEVSRRVADAPANFRGDSTTCSVQQQRLVATLRSDAIPGESSPFSRD